MKSMRRLVRSCAGLFALMASLTIPVLADDHNIDVNMTFDRGTNGMSAQSSAPLFDNPYNATGYVNITDINIPQGSARIVGLEVEFDVDVCRDSACAKINRTLHYKARFDDTVGQASLNDPQNPNSLSVTGFPPGIWVHHEGGGKPDTVLQFAEFTYSQTPTPGYSVTFTFFSREFNTNISVILTGPPPPASKR